MNVVACPKNTFKDSPGSGPCIRCPFDRATSHNGSVSRRNCRCVNTSCAPGTVSDQKVIMRPSLRGYIKCCTTSVRLSRASNFLETEML